MVDRSIHPESVSKNIFLKQITFDPLGTLNYFDLIDIGESTNSFFS